LDGKTPAGIARIDLGPGEKRWEQLIRQGIKGKKWG
jgi:hypothetical protein